MVDRPIKGHPAVAADNRGGARLAVEYLVSLGHRRIACIAGPKDSTTAKSRLAGFLDVMTPHYRAARLRIADYVAYGEFDYAGGQRAAEALLGGPEPRPTAIVAGSDQQAIGALRAAADRGIAVPSDLSVVGFDGIMLSDLVTPRLTTVVQPVAKIAEAAVAMVLGAGPMRRVEHAEPARMRTRRPRFLRSPSGCGGPTLDPATKRLEAGPRLALSWPPSLAIQDLETFHRPPNLHKSRF